MKKSIIFTLFFLLTFSQTVLAEKKSKPTTTTPILQLQTNYPSPIGNYQKLTSSYLQLNPLGSPDDQFCDSSGEKGTIYYNPDQNQILMCDGAGHWLSNLNLWAKDDAKKSIYPVDIADETSEYKVGIGTTDASFLLTLGGSGGILSKTTCAKMTGTFPSIKIDWTCVDLPDQTGGEIFAWHPKELALRAGSFDDDWDINIGYYSIAFGFRPEASETASTVSGGYMNTANNTAATVGGGDSNKAYGEYSVVSGGSGNSAGFAPTRLVYGDYSTVSGGLTNKAFSDYSSIGGGEKNTIGYSSTGGTTHAIIGGGGNNTIENTAPYATIGGGQNNTASGNYSTVSGGGGTTTDDGNKASADYATVSGGYKNTASGLYSSIAGGANNTAAGDYSFAGGRNMQLSTDADHTFAWGYSANPLSITTADRFLIFPNSSGRVGIGTTSPSVELHVEGSIIAEGNIDATAGGRVTSTYLTISGDANIFNDLDVSRDVNVFGSYYLADKCLKGPCETKSDKRLKKNVQPLLNSLTKITQLRPVTFEFIDKELDEGIRYGLIAQEVENVLPDLVYEDEENYKHINYDSLEIQMHLIEAVKELKAEVDALKEQNQQLQKQLEKITK